MSISPLVRRLFIAAAATVAAVVFLFAGPAEAAGGDVFEAGKTYCASTHPNHGTPAGFGPALDLDGGLNDLGWPIHAPNDGSVSIYSEGWGGGWGNSIMWTRADGAEKIHMAHLQDFGKTGTVAAGDVIGYLGSTGQSTGPHLHASAQVAGEPAPLVIGGRVLEAGKCYTSSGPIPPLCQGQHATLIGTQANDHIVGTKAPDVIIGKGGDDVLEGGGGADVVCGGKGSDTIIGKVGDDRLQGAAGTDVVRGGGGDDEVRGGSGTDRVVGGIGNDRLWGQGGADVLFGGKGADRLVGGAGKDIMRGGGGRDLATYRAAGSAITVNLGEGVASGQGADTLVGIERVRGSAFGDRLVGDDHDNDLYGGKGNDVLLGRRGHDLVHGGPGVDECKGEVVIACER